MMSLVIDIPWNIFLKKNKYDINISTVVDQMRRIDYDLVLLKGITIYNDNETRYIRTPWSVLQLARVR